MNQLCAEYAGLASRASAERRRALDLAADLLGRPVNDHPPPKWESCPRRVLRRDLVWAGSDVVDRYLAQRARFRCEPEPALPLARRGPELIREQVDAWQGKQGMGTHTFTRMQAIARLHARLRDLAAGRREEGSPGEEGGTVLVMDLGPGPGRVLMTEAEDRDLGALVEACRAGGSTVSS